MYHYTYLIQHKTEDKRYIGVRSCKCKPTDDTSYWGSSRHLPENVQENHVKIILKVHSSRKKAVEHEMLLHDLNDVVSSNSYYNKAKQTSTGFDTTGLKLVFSEEHKQKISKTLKNKPKSEEHKKNCSLAQKRLAASSDYVSHRKGVTLSEETKQKVSNTIKAKGLNIGTKNNRFKGWFITYPTYTKLFLDVTKEDQALMDGYPKAAYQDLCTKSKGHRPMKSGRFKGLIAGNIPT